MHCLKFNNYGTIRNSMAFYHSLKKDIALEKPVDSVFAPAATIDWLKPGVDPNKPASARPFVAPEAWKGFPGQPIIGGRQPPAQRSPWFYGEAPDLQRLIGNATPGYGS